jgi:chaperonin GroEL
MERRFWASHVAELPKKNAGGGGMPAGGGGMGGMGGMDF